MKYYNRLFIFSLLFICSSLTAQEKKDNDLMEMSLEEILNMEITSVSKKAERLQDVASSIYVLTSDDIIKSGATNLHEALRAVPGYWGAQDEYSAVQPNIRLSRSINAFDGSVLYLLDGTPIQDLITSNFTFRNFDIPLSEIERIEVIRGSGGTIYGANSATGVVNIFTKKPGDFSGLRTSIEGGAPGYLAASIRASDVLSEKVSISGYVKHRYFGGFDSMAGVDEDGNKTVASTRFKNDFNKTSMTSFGFKLDYNISEETKLSFRSHFNTLSKYDYSNYVTDQSFDILSSSITSDELVGKQIHADRLVTNIRLDHNFSDDHSLFFRISSNRENDYNKINGGYELFNAIYDFEAQDNLSIGSSFDLSFGFNHRLVHFNIHEIAYKKGINFFDPKARESLTGGFFQSKASLLEKRINITLGIKAENYSLINDKYYLSPMAKLVYLPVKSITLWGGFTQSYTTPGFNQTNIDLFFFETPPLSAWNTVATQAVYGQTYQQAYQQAITNGETPQDAAVIATNQANNFVASQVGQNLIANTASNLQSSNPSVAIRNGEIEPTKYQNWELGFRINPTASLSIEANLFYTQITDGFAASVAGTMEESKTQPGRFASYFIYDNYVKGTTKGIETLFRYKPSKRLSFEFAHSFIESAWEYQENDDFDVNAANFDKNQSAEEPELPKHVVHFKVSYDAMTDLNISSSVIYADVHGTEADYKYNDERYTLITVPETGSVVAKNDSRTIFNLRVAKKLMNDNLLLYAFGNDIFNKGIVANTDFLNSTTLSKIAAMYGLGIKYNF